MAKLLLALCLSLLAFVAVPPAQAAVIPGQTIDGPSAAILQFGDIDLAPDGTGAVAYVKDVPQDEIFVARRIGGVWQPPQQLTTLSANDQGSPQVEAGNGGRVVVSYNSVLNDFAAKVAPATGQPFSAEVPISDDVQAYDFEMNDAGVGYFVFTRGGNILARRLVGTTLTPVVGPELDNTPLDDDAGNTDQAISVDAAGNAVAAWDEPNGGNTEIYARRISGVTQGAILTATVPALAGAARSTGAQNVDVESDNAGNAWVAFREQFDYGYVTARNRPLVRRLAGNAFGPPPLLLDPGPTPPADGTDAEFTRLAVTPAGDRAVASGFIQNIATNPQLFGAALTPGAVSPFTLDAPPEPTPRTTAAIVPAGSALIAYAYKPSAAAPDVLRARVRSGVAAFGAQTPLSAPALGPVSSTDGPVASSDTGNTAVVGYRQGAAATTRILVATVDLPQPAVGTPVTPGTPSTTSVSRLRLSRTTFRKGSKLPKASAKKFKTGTTISFSLSEASKVKLSFESIRTGRRVGKKCKAPTRKNRRRKRCKRHVKVKTAISLNGKAGTNKVAFQGRLTRRRSLKPGRYRLTVTATGASGKASKPVRKNFRLLAAAKRK